MSSAVDLQSNKVLSEKLAFLNKYRIAGLNFDVPQAFKAMFHETVMIILLALIVMFSGRFLELKPDCGCAQALLSPMALIGTLLLIRQGEGSILSFLFSPLDTYGFYNPLRNKPSFKRVHRIVYNILFLVMLSVVNMAQSIGKLVELRGRHEEIYESLKKEEKMIPSLVVLVWLDITQQLIGTCAMIAITRLAIDLAIESVTFVSGYSLEKIERKKSWTKTPGIQQVVDVNSNYDGYFESQAQPVQNVVSNYS